MRLKTRLLIILILAWAFFLAIIYVGTDFYLLKNIKSKEQQDINENLSRVNKSLNQRFDSLGTFTSDWGYWNDAYDYAAGINPKFISENINLKVLANSHINFLLYLDKHNNMLMGLSTDPHGEILKPFPKNIEKYIYPRSEFIKHSKPIKSNKGLIYVENSIFLIASAATSSTDESKPMNGTIVTGRYLSEDLLDRISNDVELPLKLYLPHDLQNQENLHSIQDDAIANDKNSYILFKSDKIANGYIILRDINNKVIGMIEVTIPRTTFLSGIKAIHYYLLMIFFSALLICFLIWHFLNKYVLKRLAKLTYQIQHIDRKKDYSSRLSTTANDELSLLKKHFNKMIETVEKSNIQAKEDFQKLDISKQRLENMNKRLINEINERKQIEVKAKTLYDNLVLASKKAGISEITSGVLSDVRDILKQMSSKLVITKERLLKIKPDELASGLNKLDIANPERTFILNEVELLQKNLDHINNIIVRQQSLTHVSEVKENVKLGKVIHDAILLNKSMYKNTDINIENDIQFNDKIVIDKMKLLHILVSLIRHSIQSLLSSENPIKTLKIVTKKLDKSKFTILICDNGIETPATFMSEQNNTNFAIHTSITFVNEMGGSINMEKMDKDQGTLFIITLPILSV